MMKLLLLYFIMCIFSVVFLSYNFIYILISLEFLVLIIFIFMLLFLLNEFSLMLVLFMIMAACEGVLGLILMILNVSFKKVDMLELN